MAFKTLSSCINTSRINKLCGNCLCFEFLNPSNIFSKEDAVISDRLSSYSKPQSFMNSSEKSGAISNDFSTR